MHLLPPADQGATTKPGRKWRVETRDAVTAAWNCCSHLTRVRRALPLSARMTSGECHAPCGEPSHKRPRNIAQPGALRVRFNENFPRG